jgi:DNA modification methylase
MNWTLIQGDNRTVLTQFPDNHFDSIVTDPPYGIDFLGKDWDANTGALETYQECLRVLKPGGHLLAFSSARTYHHLAVTVEQAGFEIRDQIMWIYSSGFPKSQDVGKSIDRQSGQASHKAELAEVKAILKQLYKDSGKSTAEISRECGFNAGGYLKTDFKDKGWANNLPRDDKWLKLKSVLGCGDQYDDYFVTTPQVKVGEKQAGCFDTEFDNYTIGARSQTVDITQSQTEAGRTWSGWGTALKPAHEPIVVARKPIKLSTAKNCQAWGVGALNIDATRIAYADAEDMKEAHVFSGIKTSGMKQTFDFDNRGVVQSDNIVLGNTAGRFPSNVIGEIEEPYQKYFYCPKVSRKERHIGHQTPPAMFGSVQGAYGPDGNRMAVGLNARTDPHKGNNHPTVKPIELMKYLIRLVTPAAGHVLDPFAGSGSTGCAAVEQGYAFTGIELDPAYVAIAQRRIRAWYQATNPLAASGLFE